MCIAYDVRALREPKGHWWGRVWDPFVLEGEEANAAVDKCPRVVHVVHRERVGSCIVSRVGLGPIRVKAEAGIQLPAYRFLFLSCSSHRQPYVSR
jgi:hypothetical protein